MILATFEPYSRRGLGFTAAQQNGATCLHHDLIESALASRAIDNVHVFADPRVAPIDHAAVAELNARLGRSALVVCRLNSLVKRCQSEPYVFFCRAGQLASVCHLRASVSPSLFPICAVLHAAAWPRLLADCISLLLLAQPYDVILASSQAGAQAFRSALADAASLLASQGAEVAADRLPIVVQPLGASSLDLPGLDRSTARSLLNLPADSVLALYFGRVSEFYKADLFPLILAFRRARDLAAHPAFLVIAGQCSDPDYAQSLDAFAGTLGLAGNIRILLNVAPTVKTLLFAAADIFVSPVDNIQETFGIALLEAMAARLPVVASDWSGYREIIADNHTGFLVPTLWNSPAAAHASWQAPYWFGPTVEGEIASHTIVDVPTLTERLTRLILDPALRASFGQAGYDRFHARYSWTAVLPRLVSLWSDLRQRCPHPPQFPPTAHSGYQSFFAHYATAVYDTAWEVAPNYGASPDLRDALAQLAEKWAPGASSLLCRVASSPTTLGQLQAQYGAKPVDLLIKRGLLSLVPGPCGSLHASTSSPTLPDTSEA